MKEIVEEVPNYISVQDGTRKVTKYVADDGTVCRFREDALRIDKDIRLKKVREDIRKLKTVFIDDDSFSCWYYISNEEDAEILRIFITTEEKYINTTNILDITLEVDEWYGLEYEYNTMLDEDRYHIISWSHKKALLLSEIERFEKQAKEVLEKR